MLDGRVDVVFEAVKELDRHVSKLDEIRSEQIDILTDWCAKLEKEINELKGDISDIKAGLY